jgi:hypothetical protein
MKEKQSFVPVSNNREKQSAMVIHHVYSSSGKPLVAIIGKRAKKGDAHLKEIKEVIAKEIRDINSKMG